MPVTQSQCESVMQRLGLQYTTEPGRITVTPRWVKILDFQQRMPEFLERLARERG